jgi:peptidoglycan/xylan/chitin deacetylase (PgdA/CDA1 family)
MTEYQLPILLYHRVVNSHSKIGKHKLYVFEKDFHLQMKFLKDHGYETITFKDIDAVAPEKKVILTFDDGYEDNYTHLFPILKEFGFTAVIYLVTGSERNEWALKEGEPEIKMLSKERIREMSDYGIEFGGHTRTHVDLKNTSGKKLEEEIAGCKKDVEAITGKPAISFAYPYGAHKEETLKAVRDAGYKYGISTIFGPNNWKEDPMRIRRIEVRPSTSLSSFKRKVSGHYFEKGIYKLFSGK